MYNMKYPIDIKLELKDIEDPETLQKISEGLWTLLDEISTLSDRIKPRDEIGYRLFYECALKLCEKRSDYLTSDGCKLYIN